jgi:CubicO group peptidase (beta-lactamase class C family)
MGQSHAPSFVWPSLERAAAEVVGSFRASPCAVVACARRTRAGWDRGFGVAGRLGWDEPWPAAHAATVFDLASITKPFTALAAARLHARGDLDLAAPLAAIAPRFRGTPAGSRPLGHLLRHRAGLDAHLRLYAPVEEGRPFDPEAALTVAASAMREGCSGNPPAEGFPALYSDLGYLLGGVAMAELQGVELDELVEREVSEPVRSSATSARRYRAGPGAFGREVAPTEIVAYRGGTVRGLVHDDNAFAFANDASCGHAGMFGTASDVLALGEALLDTRARRRDDWLSEDLLAELLAPWPGGSHVFGFDTKSGPAPSAGQRFGPRTFGHLGFTGTSLWIDPDARLVGVLLTNRVHPTRDHVAIRAARPVVYDAIADAASSDEPAPAPLR